MTNPQTRSEDELAPEELDPYRDVVAWGLAVSPLLLALVDRLAATPVRRTAPRPGETTR